MDSRKLGLLLLVASPICALVVQGARRFTGCLLSREKGRLKAQLSDSNKKLQARVGELTGCNEKLQTQVSSLTDSNGKLEAEVRMLQEELCKHLQGKGSYTRGCATPYDVECTHKLLQSCMSSCTNVVWDYARTIKWKIDEELKKDSFPGAYLARAGHVKYMLMAKIFKIFFLNFENESFTPGGDTLFLDSNCRMLESYAKFVRLKEEDFSSAIRAHSALRNFCEQKFEEFVLSWKHIPDGCINGNAMSKYNSSLIINDGSNSSSSTSEILDTMTSLIETFMRAAKVVWCLHILSLSFEPRAEILRFSRKEKLHDEYMEAIEGKDEDENFVEEVGFLISPGFRVRESIIRCQIYLAGRAEQGLDPK